MWELFVLLGLVVCVMACGVIPVLFRIHGESNPSPWSYSSEETMFEGITNDAATQTSVNGITPTTIPEFSTPVSDGTDMQQSVPDEELWNSVEMLLSETRDTEQPKDDTPEHDIPIFKEQPEELRNDEQLSNIPEFESEVASRILTDEQYDAILVNYGHRVADIITCTPFQGCSGSQVMIGTFFKDGNRLAFDQDWVELKNDFKEALNGEIIVVKGNFLANGTFFVQHWDDPMMIEAGYSTFDWENHKAQ